MSNLTFSKDLEQNDKKIKSEKYTPINKRCEEFSDFIKNNNCKTIGAKMGRRNNQSRVYIGVDSDFLRYLAYIHYKKTSPEETDSKMESDMENIIAYKQNSMTKREYFTIMYNDIINDKYRIFISEPIYWENRHSKFMCNFMKELCYMPQIDKVKKDFNCLKEIEELATAYTTARTEEYNGEEKYIRPAMNKQYIASIRKTQPSNDAYIMAWCTYFGCQLLTFNGKHFIYYVRGQQAYRRISIRKKKRGNKTNSLSR